ncbi:MAG: hypothetical protein K2N33_03785, partial [Clostridia bacterium]|nr:hypothetical protein [Clostridia bacterium]
MWLTDSAQLQKKSSPFAVNASGAGWNGTGNYPSAMYGRSFIRVNMLNAGGQWATSGSTLSADYTQSASNEWARFTMDDNALGGSLKSFVQFLATPAQMEWQALENANSADYIGFDSQRKTMSNESYLRNGEKSFSGTTFTSNYFGASANAEDKSGYSDWKDDYVWLPSMVEIGRQAASAPTGSVWQCTATQRASSTTNFVRSMTYDQPYRTFLVRADGSIWYPQTTAESHSIRPCIHLNLSSIGLSPQGDTDIESVYDGTVKSISDFSPAPGWASLIEGTDYVITPKFSGEMKNVGEYTYTVEIKNTTDYWWLDAVDPQTDTKRDFTFTIKRKGVTVPTIPDNEETYNGAAYDFYCNSYNATLMDMTYPNTVKYNTNGNKELCVTNAGTYNIQFTLKDTANYGWGADGSTDVTTKSVPIIIKKKDISNSITPTAAGSDNLEWKKKEAGSITLNVATYNSENVSLYVYYVLQSNGVDYHSPAVTGHVLDVSKIAKTGTFTLCAKLIEEGEDDYVAGNANYEISANNGIWKMSAPFKILASGIDADDLTWQYKMTGQALPNDLIDVDGSQIKLQYGANINYSISAIGNADMEVYTGYNGDGFVDGYKTVDSNGNIVAGGNCGAVGTYKTYVAIKITNTTEYAFDSEHILDGNSQYGWLSFEWTISPRELDFKDAEWEYSVDSGSTWKSFMKNGVQITPEYTGFYITVRISPDYIKSLGLNPDDANEIQLTYTGSYMKKDKGNFNANVGIEINHANYITPETVDGSDYSVSFAWSITNKNIQIKNWNGSQTLVLDNGQAFAIPAIQTSDGGNYSSYLVYTYECVIDGQPQKVSDLGGLKTLLESANVGDTASLEIKATVAIKSTLADEYSLAGNNTFTFELGDSKDVIEIWLEYEQCEYGNVIFKLNASDELYLQYIHVTLSSVLLSNSIECEASNTSALLEYLVKTGDYYLTFELQNEQYSEVFVLSTTTLTFTITPKQVYVPTVNREIVFTGANINLMNYLEGFDPALMTLDPLEHRDAGTVYTATFTLIDQFNYVFVLKEDSSAEATKSTVKIVLTGYENSVSFANDEHTAAEMKWQINPFVLDGSYWSLNGKEGALFNMPTGFGELDLDVGYRYFDDAASSSPMDPVFKGGESYYVDVFLTGDDAKNFVFENGTTVSDKVVYSVPKNGAAAFFGSALGFVKSNWLWFVIGAAILLFLILLIIIIAAAKKKKKKKEEEKKEEAKAATAAAAGMPMAAMAGLAMADDGRAARAEAKAAKAKAEAQIEVERAKMQAEMAKMRAEAEAEKAKAQAQQQLEPRQPAQQPAPQVIMQQPAQQTQNNVDTSALAEIKAELAALRAAQSAQSVNAPAASPAPAPSAA